MFLVFELNYLQYFLQGCDLPPPHTPALASTMFFLGNSFFSPFFLLFRRGKSKGEKFALPNFCIRSLFTLTKEKELALQRRKVFLLVCGKVRRLPILWYGKTWVFHRGTFCILVRAYGEIHFLSGRPNFSRCFLPFGGGE